MPEYSPFVILFIGLHLLSLFLISFLIYVILKTGPYVTKWTLFQLCVCALVMSLSCLPLILIYGDSLQDNALDSPLCIIQSKIILFIFCPLKIFPAVLSVYLWFMVARINYDLEQKIFWHVSGVVWAITIITNTCELIISSKEKDWSVQTGILICKSAPSERNWLIYIIITTSLAFMSLVITAHSSYILWNRWRSFNQKQNRRTAIDLGYAVRLTVLSACYSIILLSSIMQTIMFPDSNSKNGFIDFATSFFGAILFMIFGTTKSAAIFLPCCYYLQPEKPGSIPTISPLPESVDLDAITKSSNLSDMTITIL